MKEGTFRRGAPRENPSARTQLFAADRRTSHGSRKKKLSGTQRKRLRKQKKATAAQRADGGPGARGDHIDESCTGTDVNTRGSSRTKRPLSPGGTPQDAQSQVKRTKKPSTEAPGETKKHHLTLRDLRRFYKILIPHRGFHSILVRNTRGFTGKWTMGPSAAWFYEGQLRLHRNNKCE